MKDTLVVFTYALAGLGHLRVTDTLQEAMPQDFNSVLLESQDETIKKIHRFTSVHPVIRRIYEWAIDGPLSFFFTRLYKSILKGNTRPLLLQVDKILENQKVMPRKIVFISTHFAIAHQVTAIKEKLEKEKGIKVYLVVQVTDDFAHPMWYVEGADLLVVPSQATKEKFEEISSSFALHSVDIAVCPYPVSPFLTQVLKPEEKADKIKQLDPKDSTLLQISIPVSGAAVNLNFYHQLIRHLFTLSGKVFFQVTTKKAPYTLEFLKSISGSRRVAAYISEIDSDIVHFYDELFAQKTIALEITKPSEQAFKALLDTDSRGGVILLFSQPFGPQEESNLDFLTRHSLIPDHEYRDLLWTMPVIDENLRSMACGWRGIQLPHESRHAAQFILWCLDQKIFSQMLLCPSGPKTTDPSPQEISKNGAEKFWELVTTLTGKV